MLRGRPSVLKTLPPPPAISNFNQFCQDCWGRVWNAPSTIVRTAYNKLSDLKFSKVLKYFFIWEKIHLMNNKYIENMLMALFFGLLRRSHKCITYNLIINLFWKGDYFLFLDLLWIGAKLTQIKYKLGTIRVQGSRRGPIWI